MQFLHCHWGISIVSLSQFLICEGCNSASSAELLWGVSWGADLPADMTQPSLSTGSISVLTSCLGEVTS